jgi:hypothetical protein
VQERDGGVERVDRLPPTLRVLALVEPLTVMSGKAAVKLDQVLAERRQFRCPITHIATL